MDRPDPIYLLAGSLALNGVGPKDHVVQFAEKFPGHCLAIPLVSFGCLDKRPKAEAGNADHVGAPMPGVVASIGVQPGQEVSEGDLLLTIEAMKMETEVRASHDGTIQSVDVQAGDSVAVGDTLVTLG